MSARPGGRFRIGRLKSFLLFGAILIGAVGCGRAQTVTKVELSELLARSRGTDNVVLYYKGSSDRFDHFVLVGRKGERSYRITYGNIPLSQRFRTTEDSSKWVVTTIR